MTSLAIVANGDKLAVLEAITVLKTISDLKIVFIKQSDKKLYIVDERVFDIVQGGA